MKVESIVNWPSWFKRVIGDILWKPMLNLAMIIGVLMGFTIVYSIGRCTSLTLKVKVNGL